MGRSIAARERQPDATRGPLGIIIVAGLVAHASRLVKEGRAGPEIASREATEPYDFRICRRISGKPGSPSHRGFIGAARPARGLLGGFGMLAPHPRCPEASTISRFFLNGDMGTLQAGSDFSEADVRRIRIALDMGRPVLAEIEYRGVNPAGEIRYPVIRDGMRREFYDKLRALQGLGKHLSREHVKIIRNSARELESDNTPGKSFFRSLR